MPHVEPQGKLEQFFLLSQDLLCCLDFSGRLLNANPTFASLLGYSVHELLGMPCGVVIDPRDYPVIESALARLKEHGQIGAFDVRARTATNDQVWLEVTASAGDEVVYVIARDITLRKRSDQQLRLLERSLASSTNGVVIVDALSPGLPMVYVNAAFERITGYSSEQALGNNCRFLQGSDSDQETIDRLREGIEKEAETHVVIRNYRRDGTPFWNDLYISPVRDEWGQVSHFIGVQNDITAQRDYQAQLRYNADHDTLTGLPNRHLLDVRLQQACQLAKRYQRFLAVLFIDLDDFKPINDTLGHEVGDFILSEVAKRLEIELRPWDTVARFGGDEFVVVLPDLAFEVDVMQVVDRLLASISAPYDYDHGNYPHGELRISASIGVVTDTGRIDDPRLLIQQADLAMYKAKQRGRNTYQWYTDELNSRVADRVSLRNALQQAIEQHEFELYFQPQVREPGGQTVGVEALIRWRHPTRGYVSPASFIALAEQTGQIIPISEWVLENACRAAVALNAVSHAPVAMAVNVSPMQFQRPGFLDSVHRVLEHSGLPPELLELELTEGVLMDNAEGTIALLAELRAAGVHIALDDFGTGFSSLSYLKHLPINRLKIDRSFINEVVTDTDDAAIVDGVVTMARKLGLEVMVEGLETAEQLSLLRTLGCEYFQGYFYAYPLPFAELERALGSAQPTYRRLP